MLWWIAAIVVVLDQLTKFWAVKVLYNEGQLHTIVVVENFFQLSYAENRGGAASILDSHPQLLTALSIIALAVIVWWALQLPASDRLGRIGFGAVLGGAVGNLLDRLFRGGFVFDTHVVDFLDAHWFYRYHWPTFNVADTAICVGIALIIFSQFRLSRAGEADTREVAKSGKSMEKKTAQETSH
jgi:signal peptidase II